MKRIGFTILTIFLFSALLKADATHDATTSVVTSANTTLHTFSHSNGCSSNGVIYVFARSRNVANTSASGVTYAGVSLTLINDSNGVSDVAADDLWHNAWRLINPATGANNVIVTLTAASDAILTAMTVCGAHQTTPEGTIVEAQSTNNATASLAVTSETGGLVIDSFIQEGNGADPTMGALQTERSTNQGALVETTLDAETSTEPGQASVTMSRTSLTTFTDWTFMAIPVRPAPASVALNQNILTRRR